jgi:X-X-X-Leu-X-X-Gly heptad repeat protein
MIQKFIDEFKERTGKDLQVGENGSLSGQKPEKQKEKDEDFKKLNDGIGKLTGGLSQIAGGLKAFGIEIPQEVDQVIGVINGISQVISGVGSIISLFSTTALTANTAAIAANTAALATNTATNFIPFFANGGIVPHAANGYYVPGSSFSGDNTPILANAGELVLSKSQQGNLASQLEGGSMQNLNIDWVLTGDKLRAVLNNNGRRTGRGELVQRNRI